MHLLIVEDVPANQRLLRIQLEAAGHAVTVAGNGVQALEALANEQIDGIVSDIVMPEMDGFRLCLEVRRDERLKRLPFVVYTATYESPGDRELARQVGVDAYVRKPAPVEQIIDAVADALRKGHPAKEPHELPSDNYVLHRYSAALVRKLEEQNIKYAELSERLADLLDYSYDLVQALTLDGRFVYVNRTWHDLLGYDASDLTTLSVYDIVDEASRAACRALFRAVAEGEPARYIEASLVAKDGRRLHVEGGATAKMVGGVATMIRCTWRDVTDRKAAEAARRGADERLAGLVEASMDAIITIDERQRVAVFNPAAERMFEWRRSEALGKPLGVFLPGRFRALHQAHVAEFGRTGATSRHMGALLDLTGLRRDGSEFPVEVSISQMDLSDGHYYTAILRDISQRKEYERRITRLSRVQAVLSGINSAIVRIRERKPLFVEACRIAIEQGGLEIAWIGEYDAQSGEVRHAASQGIRGDASETRASANEALPEGKGLIGRAIRARQASVSNDVQGDANVGAFLRAELLARAIGSCVALPLFVDDDPIGVLVLFAKEPNFFTDDEMKLLLELAGDLSFALSYAAHSQRAEHLERHDPLTGLENRSRFVERLGDALENAKQAGTPVAVVVGDIDRFRQINETLGRRRGDALLRHMSAHMRSLAPDLEYLARTGADEFAAIVTRFDSAADIGRMIDGMLPGLAQMRFDVGDASIPIAMTLGVATGPQDGDGAETLFRSAETALQNAKQTGKRYLVYESSMSARVVEMFALESKLRTAIAEGQFELYYQPKLDAVQGTVTGFEALLRWNDPERGVIGAGEFVPLLEQNGMIVEVGAWAIRRALSQAADWRAEGASMPRIAVNLSPVQLEREDFVAFVSSLLSGHDSGSPIDFEITEATALGDLAGKRGALDAIRKLGAQIAIDDFGIGYSSLAYLAKLPVNALKIDRSFTVSMTDAPESMTIVSTIISLAHAMNLKVVAEGVETDEQAKFLRLLKCDEVQGFLYGRPMPAAQARAYVAERARPATGDMANGG